jgi:hypothetical protein
MIHIGLQNFKEILFIIFIFQRLPNSNPKSTERKKTAYKIGRLTLEYLQPTSKNIDFYGRNMININIFVNIDKKIRRSVLYILYLI